jgi:formate hydrogenlyase transcriptional activator
VEHFAGILGRRVGRSIDHIPDETMMALCSYDWPGNIRELQNYLERAVVLSSGPRLFLPHSELNLLVKNKTPAATQTLAEAERSHISEVLQQSGGVVGGRDGAAARLGIPRTTLLHRMQKLGLRPPNRS